jgi:hypothetical protein
MPRKNRSTALVVVLALLVSLASQAAVALPLGSRSANDTVAGDFLSAAWGWLTGQLAGLGHAVTVQATHVPGAWAKTGSTSDPNNGHRASCRFSGPHGLHP